MAVSIERKCVSMAKHLLPQVPQYFKANLHTHTTISDGKLTPEEVKAEYMARGYQIVAFTDHEVCVSHPELAEEKFLPLTGYELSFNSWEEEKFLRKTYHLCCIAKTPENRWQVYDPAYKGGNAYLYADNIVCDGYETRGYSLEQVNDVIARTNAHGFLVAYNHPTWSLQEYEDYAGLQGLWAMEVYNNHCHRIGYDDNNSHIYQTMLKLGNRFYPLATDDFHRIQEHNFIGGGWVMVGAEKLDYASVIAALEKGDFYASTGPVIHSLDVDGTVLKLRCSGVRSVKVFTQSRHATELTHYDGTALEEAEFDLAPWLNCWKENGKENEAFIRLMFIDAHGNNAYTRAYWYDELV